MQNTFHQPAWSGESVADASGVSRIRRLLAGKRPGSVAANVTVIHRGAADTAGLELQYVGKGRLGLAEQNATHHKYGNTDHHHGRRYAQTRTVQVQERAPVSHDDDGDRIQAE